MAGIITWGSYIPKYRIKVDDIARVQGKDANNIKKGLNITEKSVPGIDEDTITISVEAARAALSKVQISPKKIGAIKAITIMRPVQGTSGANTIVSSRGRLESMMRAPITAGTLQPNPRKSGRKERPCNPIRCMNRSIT